jgi:Na+-transporting methylmalonyl-CoA/oxaloacetate decarboxylase gamma subunit
MNLLEITSGTWTITLIGWGIVFVALVLLVLIFTLVPAIHHASVNRKLRKENKFDDSTGDISGEENAAIAMALFMYMNEQHDEESGVITIKNIERRYSPWSSKIYGLNNQGF